MQLVLVRHGQTMANIDGRWTGWSTTPLSELGRAQIQAVARRLAESLEHYVAIYTSPLPRASATAAEIGRALKLQPITVDGLREINFGDLDGVTLEEMEQRYPELYASWQDKTDASFVWPGGEMRADFYQRVATTCRDIVSRHKDGIVVVVSHGGTLRSCLAHLLPSEMAEWWTYQLDNCGLTRIQVDDGNAQLVVLNDTAHLP
jgi:broad specificity phosphatase PhoE